MNPDTSIIFKYLSRAEDGKAYQQLAEFESDSKSQAISNLYLSSQVTSHKMLLEYLNSDEYLSATAKLDKTFVDFHANDANLRKLNFLNEQFNWQNRLAAPAQMSLGNRYQYGMTLAEDCDASTMYYEAAARQTIKFIERTHGL